MVRLTCEDTAMIFQDITVQPQFCLLTNLDAIQVEVIITQLAYFTYVATYVLICGTVYMLIILFN